MTSQAHAVGKRLEARLTYADYCALPDDGRRYQLIEGDLHVTPAPATSHQRISKNLVVLLEAHVRQHRLGVLLYAPVDVILADDTVVQPDLVFVAADRRSIVTERAVEGAPDLVVEILSPSTRRLDRTGKMRTYAHHRVRECWIVDPEAQTIELFRLDPHAGAYVLAVAAGGDEGDTVSSELLPGLSVALAEIFAPDL